MHLQAVKGTWGDICNIGSADRAGGACTAAAFLERFVEDGVSWAHLDVAGPAMAKKAKPPVCAGQTGFGASLVLHWLRHRASDGSGRARVGLSQ